MFHISACTKLSIIALYFYAHFLGITEFLKQKPTVKECLRCVYVCVFGVSVFLTVSPPWFRVNEAVYWRLAQLVGAGD